MTRRDYVGFYIDALSRTFEEYKSCRFYNEALARRKELLLYVRQLENHINYLDSEIRLRYTKETGIRAVGPLWKRLGTKHKKDESQDKSTK